MNPLEGVRWPKGQNMHYQQLSERGWVTMLGVLTMVTNAVSGVPWANGAGKAKPHDIEVGGVYVDGDGIPFTVDAVNKWQAFTYWASISPYEHRPATVVPTPTADDWIDPAVRLPEVGEWVWWLTKYGNLNCTRHSGTFGGARWAPILVGPPPIPDASEVE